jgi:hypothetical protein
MKKFQKNNDLFIQVHKSAKYSSTNQKSETEVSGSQISKDSKNEQFDDN